MSNSCTAILIALNPLLLRQIPRTRLPRSGAVHPERIPRHAGRRDRSGDLHPLGRDTHGDEWNNEVSSYDPVSMTWARSHPQDGRKTTTTGHPWAMHSVAMNAWDAAGLVEYDPAGQAWTPIPRGPDLRLGHICSVPSFGRVIGF